MAKRTKLQIEEGFSVDVGVPHTGGRRRKASESTRASGATTC